MSQTLLRTHDNDSPVNDSFVVEVELTWNVEEKDTAEYLRVSIYLYLRLR